MCGGWWVCVGFEEDHFINRKKRKKIKTGRKEKGIRGNNYSFLFFFF